MKRSLRKILPIALLFLGVQGCGDAPPSAGAPDARAGAAGMTLIQALAPKDAYARARNLGTLLPSLDAAALPEVRQVLDGNRLGLGAVEFELLLRFWASLEPAEATLWTFRHAPPLYRVAAARTAMEMFAASDPGAALLASESALAIGGEEIERIAKLGLVQGWFLADRAGLERYVYGLGSGADRQRALYAFLLTLAASEGSEAAIAWAEALSDEDVRYKLAAYRQLMTALAWGDMPAALRFCEAHCDGPYGKRLRTALVRSRLRDGEYGGDVVSWVAGVPDGDEAQRAEKRYDLGVAYSTWAYRDREAALAWMRDRLAEDERPQWLPFLYSEFARQLAAESPAEALEWAARVDHDAAREVLMIRIARAWRRRDQAAADAWLQQSPLSEAAREKARDISLPTYIPEPRPPSA